MLDKSVTSAASKAVDIALHIAHAIREVHDFWARSDYGVEASSQGVVGAFAGGTAGSALLFHALWRVTSDDEWMHAAHVHLAESLNYALPALSLFGGRAGQLLAARIIRPTPNAYRGLIESLSRIVVGAALEATEKPYKRAENTIAFELINGLAGALIALDPCESAAEAAAATRIIEYMHWLSGSENGLPRWCVPTLAMSSEDQPWRTGYNVSISHGITGVLASLCLSNVQSAHRFEAIRNFADWIAQRGVVETQYGPEFAGFVNGEHKRAMHAAWCYGTPAVAATLALASTIENGRWSNAVQAAVKTLAARPLDRWQLHDPQICHGYVGTALTLATMPETDVVPLRAAIASLCDLSKAAFDGQLPLGYRVRHPVEGVLRPLSCAGLLQGSTGIALGLLTLDGTVSPDWLRFLGLGRLTTVIA